MKLGSCLARIERPLLPTNEADYATLLPALCILQVDEEEETLGLVEPRKVTFSSKDGHVASPQEYHIVQSGNPMQTVRSGSTHSKGKVLVLM